MIPALAFYSSQQGRSFTRKSFSITTLDEKEASLQENAEAIKIQGNIWNEHPGTCVHVSPAVLVLFGGLHLAP